MLIVLALLLLSMFFVAIPCIPSPLYFLYDVMYIMLIYYSLFVFFVFIFRLFITRGYLLSIFVNGPQTSIAICYTTSTTLEVLLLLVYDYSEPNTYLVTFHNSYNL